MDSCKILFVVQTSFHIIWVICGYYFYVCKIKPSYYGLVILYLTYFYKGECGNVTLKCDEIFEPPHPGPKADNVKIHYDDSKDADIFDIIQTILDRGVLPAESTAAYRTHIYFHAFILSDAAWIISAFLLFAGTCFQIKKCLSLLFYCPWLTVTGCIILLDVISSVHFGLDILTITNFTSWLKFIGVQNYQDFTEYNKHSLSYIVPLVPALSLCVLFSRGLVLWIWNIVLFVQVLNTAILAYQDSLDGNDVRTQRKKGRSRTTGQDLNLDSSASRIRNWQLFYGAIDTTSSSSSSDRDVNSNNTMRRTSTKVKITTDGALPSSHQNPDMSDSYEKYIMSIRQGSLKMKPEVSTYYHGYTDVAESFDNTLGRGGNLNGPHTSQTHWLHVRQPEERYESDYNVNHCGNDRYGMANPATTLKTTTSTDL